LVTWFSGFKAHNFSKINQIVEIVENQILKILAEEAKFLVTWFSQNSCFRPKLAKKGNFEFSNKIIVNVLELILARSCKIVADF
jgi:hypothetical protein